MDRRQAMRLFGTAGIGLGIAGETARAQVGEDADHSAGHGAAKGPLDHPHAHFCGVHVAKNNPKFQLITQHYCAAHQHDADPDDAIFQCVLFENVPSNPKILGIEYIISDKRYRALPEAEKQYWHPHTYEVLGGGLIAPEMRPEEELEFMKGLLRTWGKTWHTWPDPTSEVPLGEPLLIWSLTADDQPDPKIMAERDRQYGVSTAKIRETRAKAFGFAPPDVSFPRSIDQIGRQWTDRGADEPKPASRP